jgi:DNA-binding CsgD family transcriptional regulator
MPTGKLRKRRFHGAATARTILTYAAILGVAATALTWLEHRFWVRALSGEIYLLLVALVGAALGAWLATMLTPRPRSGSFEPNLAAIGALSLTPRELEVLAALAAGDSNKIIARKLGISPQTLKTHVARVCGKLEVERRGQAVDKARFLELIP